MHTHGVLATCMIPTYVRTCRGRGDVRVGAGRPKTGITYVTVHLFLGKDEKARNLRAELEEIKAQFNHRSLRVTVS